MGGVALSLCSRHFCGVVCALGRLEVNDGKVKKQQQAAAQNLLRFTLRLAQARMHARGECDERLVGTGGRF